MRTTTLTILACLIAICSAQSYNNALQGLVFFQCPSGQVVSEIQSSAYSTASSDRQWSIGCQPFFPIQSCSWSSSVGTNGQDFNFACPLNQVIRGVYAEYQPTYKNRKWAFECCSSSNIVTTNCQNGTMVNYYNENFTWFVPGGNYLTGVSSDQKNSNGDHRWSYKYCKAVQNDLTVTTQILSVNREKQPTLTQGDVQRVQTRNANLCAYCKWPISNGVVQVPYVISSDFTDTEKALITNAMLNFKITTCVSFVPKTTESNYISIVKEGGCWSFVGRQGGLQKVSLGNGCIYYGIIQHELMHVLSFWHEQNRNDRDSWIQVHSENIISGSEANFAKLNTDNLGVEYDYNSVMHYGSKDFSSNGKDTITPLVAWASIGQRFGMSESDILKINKLYTCNAYLPKYGDWDNELGGVLSVTCASGQTVSRIKSNATVSNDRLWRISCKAFQNVTNPLCKWSAFINDYQGVMDYTCPDNYVVGGVYAEASSVNKDRRWKVQCCYAQNFTTFNCKTTPPVNYWNEAFDMPIASGNLLIGVKSSYSSELYDRRWSFTYCQGRFQ